MYVDSSGTFNMTGDSIISGNNATTEDGLGGGVYVGSSGTFTMTGGNISNNTADHCGGVYLRSSQFITVTGALTSTALALNITPGFENGTVISYNAGVSPGTWTDNFALNTTWTSEHSLLALGQSGNEILLGTNCTVNFSIDDATLYIRQYNVTGALLAQPVDPTKTGNTFNGWNISSASGDPWEFDITRISENTDLYANWTVNPTPPPTSSGGGNAGNNANSGALSREGAFTTSDGGLTLQYPPGTSAIITIFSNYIGGGISLPPNVSYLNLYDVYSTAQPGTPVTLVFNVDPSQLDELGVSSDKLTILHNYDGEWHPVGGSYDEEDHTITVIRTHLSPFMVAYNVDESLFPLEVDATPTSTPTTSPTQVEPTVVVPTTTPTETPSSPVPFIGIIA